MMVGVKVGEACPCLEIEFSYSPGNPGCWYQRNGDPGWPPEPAEVEVIKARLISGDGLTPSDADVAKWAADYIESDDGFAFACEGAEADRTPDPDDERDRRRDDALTDQN